MPTQSLPFNATKETQFKGHAYGVENQNNVIPDRLYDNMQLTQYVSASTDPELGASSFRKFMIPGSSNVLLAVSFGGATDWRTDVLCVVNTFGIVVSTLEAAVCVTDVYVKQFRIDAQNQIIVTTIKPVSTVSIPLATFSSFSGYRQDISYVINEQGQFVQNTATTYQSKTYTRSYLMNESINLWEGEETPL
ncbi:MAG: hypothetical protein LBR65_03770 [Culturomica sp.]|nr:hypothetical protein [Culturomica sp.]